MTADPYGAHVAKQEGDDLGRIIAGPPVFLYGRTSSEEQADAGTIDAQQTFLRNYAELMHMPVLGAFWDDGVSGTIPLEERPEGRKLVDACQATPGAVVLFTRVDRLGRSLKVLLAVYEQLDALGATIKSATEPFDTANAMGRFFFQLLASMAELGRANLLDNLTQGRDRVARQGRWTGGPIPYGLDVPPLVLSLAQDVVDRLEDDGPKRGANRKRRNTSRPLVLSVRPVPAAGEAMTESDVMRDVYHRVYRGSSVVAECLRLAALGVVGGRRYADQEAPAKPRPWSPSTLAYQLHNPIYKGVRGLNSKNGRIEHLVPALVSEAIWDGVQLRLVENRRLSKKNAKRDYLLRGLIRCANCGGAYVGGPGGNNRNHPDHRLYYRCTGGQVANHLEVADRCRAKLLPAVPLEDWIWDECKAFAAHPGETLEAALAQREGRLADVSGARAERARLLRLAAAKDQEREIVLAHHRSGRITLRVAERDLDKINAEEAELRRQAEQQRTDLDLAEAFATRVERAQAALGALQRDVAQIETLTDPVERAKRKREKIVELVAELTVRTEGTGYRKTATVAPRFTFGGPPGGPGLVVENGRAQPPVVYATPPLALARPPLVVPASSRSRR